MYPYIDIYVRKIPSYGLMLAIGVVSVFFLAYRRLKGEGMDRAMDRLLLVGTCTVGGFLLGANLLYIFVTYSLEEIWAFISDFNFQPLGGLVFYGGLFGGIFGAWLGSKLAKAPLLDFERAVIPFVPMGYGFGRIGCFLGGCCYGMAYDGIFAVQYPQQVCENHGVVHAPADVLRFPTQLLDTLISFVVCIFLVLYSRKQRKRGSLILMYLGIYCVQRFFVEFLRDDAVRGIYGLFSTSQWISLGVAVVVTVLLIVMHCKKGKEETKTVQE